MSQSIMSPPISVSPEAAFIAASAASQIVTNDHDSHADIWYDQHGFQPSGEPVSVSHAALCQLNNFLDHLLFNFLALSGTTSLSKLRLAVVEVLKPKLAKDAINNAEEELREYLGGGDDEEFLQSPITPSPKDWDLELIWKRTRLRCMVYSSLGDMEEEDEDHHMEEGLLGGDEASGDNVSPAVAIFLTSILEYLGEQALISAGQAAWNRMRIRYEKETRDSPKGRSDIVDKIMVEELDMERVALDRTLGRLWRAWKKRVRSGPGSVDLAHRSASRENMYRMRLGSLAGPDGNMPPPVQESLQERDEGYQQEQVTTEAEMDDGERAAAIPLPMGEKDVDEIEVPGLVRYSDDESEEEEDEPDARIRPKSFVIIPRASKEGPPTPSISQPQTPVLATRKRANSLPTPAASPYDKRKKADNIELTPTLDTLVQENAQGTADVPEVAVNDEASNTTKADLVSDAVEDAAATGTVAAAAAATVLPNAKKLPGSREEGEEDTDLEEIEEAQILTTSRISIGGSISGRSDSPANSDRGSRPPLSLHSLPVRSGSLRLVDVASPRTPSARSQRSSYLQEPTGGSSSRTVSRPSSTHTQPNLEEPREAEDARAPRISGAGSSGKARSNVADSISEAEEAEQPVMRSALSATLPAPGHERDPASAPEDRVILTPDEISFQEQKKSRRQGTQPFFASAKRQSPTSPQRSPTIDFEQQLQRSPRMGGTVGTPPDSATYLEDDVGPLPQRYPRQSPRQSPRQYGAPASPTGPAVPERSSGRGQHAHTQSAGAQPGTIGIVSVDRPSAYKDNGEVTRPSVDQATIRPFHTPASSISSHKLRGARASQDSTATRPEDVARHFEELIQSDETIQYTLTPENMREIEGSPRSLQSGSKSRSSDDAHQASRERAASSTKSVRQLEVKRSASISRATGLRSHPVEIMTDDKRGPPVSMANRARGGAIPQAREPTVPRESVLEFAEFIRATGPPGAAAEVPPVQPNMGLRRNPSLMRDGPPSLLRKASVDQSRPSMSGSVSRARLQARDATVDNSNDHSDLIDFIRRGPPNAGNPRIPRTVAPFRTTMDSDQMSAAVAVGGKAMDAQLSDHDMRYSQASTNMTEFSAPSVQSSVNSQSALLGRKQSTAANGTFDDQDMMPQRKQRRVRDPYALDFSDEEEEDDFDYQPQPSRKIQPKEESLIDFLNSAPPPPPSEPPVPFNLPRTQSMPSKAQAPKKKASAPGLMARFRQNSTTAASTSGRSNPPPSAAGARSLGSRAGPPASKGYIPIQVNIPTGGDLYPGYGSSSSPAAPAVPSMPTQYSSSSSARPSGRVPMKKFEPREAVSVPSRGTSDLADFLKFSEPPSAAMSGAGSAEPAEASSSKLFGRRKKSTGFA